MLKSWEEVKNSWTFLTSGLISFYSPMSLALKNFLSPDLAESRCTVQQQNPPLQLLRHIFDQNKLTRLLCRKQYAVLKQLI
mmetsp:Transcript_23911/g.41977  ORF Transcript_23911/g.41977 Transcript_23911/m.41977 type:complete len:81 (-) Transcript_23911:861-1103(-)